MSTNLETILSTTLFNFVKKENKSINLVELKKASTRASAGVDLLIRNYGDYLDADEIRPAIDTISSIGGSKDKIDLLPENLSSPDTYIESESETVNALVQYSNSGTESKLTKEKAEEIVKKAQSNSPQGFDTMLSVSSSVKSNIVIPQPIITNSQNQVSLPSDDNKDKTLRDPDTNQPFPLRDIEIKLDNLEIGGQKLIGLDKKTAEYLTQNGRIQNVKIKVNGGNKETEIEIDTRFAFVLDYDAAGKVSGIKLRMNSSQLPTSDFMVTSLSVKSDDNESTPITLNSSIKANDRKLNDGVRPLLLDGQINVGSGSNVNLTFSEADKKSVFTLSQALVSKAALCTDPQEECEVLINNYLDVLDKRFLLFGMFSSSNAWFPNYTDVPLLQHAQAVVNMAASNYVGKVISQSAQNSIDPIFEPSLFALKDIVKGDPASKFDFSILEKTFKEKGAGRMHPDLINKMIKAKPQTIGEAIELVRQYSSTLPKNKQPDFLNFFGLSADDLMVNYVVTQRIDKILKNRIDSIQAIQKPVQEAFDKLTFNIFIK